jgi:dephospho-CoA kinase
LRVPLYDADAAVHALQARGGAALPPIGRAFPGVVKDGALDRAALGARVFNDPAARRVLEGIVHPLVGAKQREFLRRARLRRAPLVVLDIPLLFEGGGHRRVDAVFVVSAGPLVQRQRVLARPIMTPEKLAGILRTQTPDRVKRRLARVVLPTGGGRGPTLRALSSALRALSGARGRAWPPNAYRERRLAQIARSNPRALLRRGGLEL